MINNCENANLSGVKPVRREVDQEQGSNRPSRLVLKLTGEQRNQDQDQRLPLSSVACFFSALEFNRTSVVNGIRSSLRGFERPTLEESSQESKRQMSRGDKNSI